MTIKRTDLRGNHSICSLLLAAAVMGCGGAPADTSADLPNPETIAPPITPTPATVLARSRLAWRKSMSNTSLPKEGCFVVRHPDTAWQEVPCAEPATTTDNRPFLPTGRGGQVGPFTVGGGETGFEAVPTSPISWAEGSFPQATGLIWEKDNNMVPDEYSVQLNSNQFRHPTLCNGAVDPTNCFGWQQFIYYQGHIFIEYWLLNYNNTCPAGWNTILPGRCWVDSTHSPVPAQTITDLPNMALIGQAGSAGDSVMLAEGNDTLYALSVGSSVLHLNNFWTLAEFNVFGGPGGGQAVFNDGATMIVQLLTNTTPVTTNAPNCISGSMTHETNSLTVVPNSCCPLSGSRPGIQFMQSSNSEPPDPQACPLAAWEIQQQMALQANTNTLWLDRWGFGYPTSFGMKPGTVPSLLALPTGGYDVAFQANTGHLWFDVNGTGTDTGGAMLAGTSPALTMLQNQMVAFAYQGSNGHLWFGVGNPSAGVDTSPHRVMRAGTSPSLTVLPLNGTLALAFQGSNGHLWIGENGGTGGTDTNGAMAAGTSPSIAAPPHNNEHVAFAFQGINGHLWVGWKGPTTGFDTQLGMRPGTSPSVAVLQEPVNATVNSVAIGVAFQAQGSGNLWLYTNVNGTPSAFDTGFGMQNSSSPLLLPLPGGGYQIAFKGSNGNLWVDFNGEGIDQGLGMN